MITIKTQPYLGQRIGATIIDYFIIFVFSFVFILVFGEPNDEGGKTVSGPLALIPVLFWFFWLVVPEALGGQTLGHYLTGLKVVTMDGTKLIFWQALVRRLCDVIDISCCFGLVAFILVQTSKYNQRLGDILAKTLVVAKNFQANESAFEFESQVQNQ